MSKMKYIQVRFDSGRSYAATPHPSGMAGKTRWIIYRMSEEEALPIHSVEPKQKTGIFANVTPGKVFSEIEDLERDEMLNDQEKKDQ